MGQYVGHQTERVEVIDCNGFAHKMAFEMISFTSSSKVWLYSITKTAFLTNLISFHVCPSRCYHSMLYISIETLDPR